MQLGSGAEVAVDDQSLSPAEPTTQLSQPVDRGAAADSANLIDWTTEAQLAQARSTSVTAAAPVDAGDGGEVVTTTTQLAEMVALRERVVELETANAALQAAAAAQTSSSAGRNVGDGDGDDDGGPSTAGAPTPTPEQLAEAQKSQERLEKLEMELRAERKAFEAAKAAHAQEATAMTEDVLMARESARDLQVGDCACARAYTTQ